MPSIIPIFDEQTAKKNCKKFILSSYFQEVLFMYYYIICCSYYIFKGLLMTFLAKCYTSFAQKLYYIT